MITKTKPQPIAAAAKPDAFGAVPLLLNDASAVPEGWGSPQSTRWTVLINDKVVARSRKRKDSISRHVGEGTTIFKVVLHHYFGSTVGSRATVAFVTVKKAKAKAVLPASQSGLQLKVRQAAAVKPKAIDTAPALPAAKVVKVVKTAKKVAVKKAKKTKA